MRRWAAIIWLAAGKAELAKAGFHGSLAARQRDLRGSHPDLFASYWNLAVVNLNLGDHFNAENFAKQAIELSQTSLGASSPKIADLMEMLAALQMRRKSVIEAEGTLRRALRTRQSAVERNNPEIASTMSKLALVIAAQGRLSHARTELEAALLLARTKISPDHPELVHVLVALAKICNLERRFETAAGYARKALLIINDGGAYDNAYRISALQNLIVSQEAIGDTEGSSRSVENLRAIDPSAADRALSAAQTQFSSLPAP
jgi:tetratricopeptide (TPR) repeat protein